MYNYQSLKDKWLDIIKKMEKKTGESIEFDIEKPATEEELLAIEDTLKMKLPSSYREFLLHFSKGIHFRWFLPDEVLNFIPKEFGEIFSGEISFHISELENLTELADEFMAQDDEDWAGNLRNKLGFTHSGNGDIYAFDMSVEGAEKPIVYWEHEEDKVSYVADSFTDYLEKITELYCIGNEIWQFEKFLTEKGLNPSSELAQKWRVWVETYINSKLFITHRIEEVFNYILLNGVVNDVERNVLSYFDNQVIFEKALSLFDNADNRRTELMCKVIGECVGNDVSDWVRELWLNNSFNSNLRSYLAAKCLPEDEGLHLVYSYLETVDKHSLSTEAEYALSHFRSHNVISWMEKNIKYQPTYWANLFTLSDPSWNDILRWLQMDDIHRYTVIHALEIMVKHYNYGAYPKEKRIIRDLPSTQEVIYTLKQVRKSEILETKKYIIDNVIEHIDLIFYP